MRDNIDKFLNRLLYSLYNLMYFSGLPIYAAVELLVQRPLYCLPFWKRQLKEKYGINTFKEYKDRTRSGLYKTLDHPASGFTQYCRDGYNDEQLNTNELVWNARLERSILNGNLTFILDGFDILGNLSNVRHSINAQGITETYYNVVPAYGMLHIVYKLNIEPKKRK